MHFTFIHYIALIFFLGAIVACNNNSTTTNKTSTTNNNTAIASTPTAKVTYNKNIPQSDTSYKLAITVEGLGQGYAKLLGIFGNQNYVVDSAKVDSKGHMLLEGKEGLPGGLYFVVLPQTNNQYLQVLLADDQHLTMQTKLSNLVGNMKVDGSLDNELFYDHLNFQTALDNRLKIAEKTLKTAAKDSPEAQQAESEKQKIVDERIAHINDFATKHPDAFFTKFKLAGQNPVLKYPKKLNGEVDETMQVYLYRNEFWDNVDFNDERLLRTPVFYNKLEKFITQLTDQKPDSLIKYADYIIQKTINNKELFKHTTNYIALQYQPKKTTLMGGEAVYVHIIDKYFTYEKAFWSDSTEIRGLRKEARDMMPSLIGKTGQDVKAKNVEGKYVSLYDSKSPIKIVFIYSATCEHCQEEAPKLAKVYEEWHNKGVDIFGICTDADENEWKKFVKKYNLPWQNVIDPDYESGYYKKYHIDITPELYVLDKNHTIVAKNVKSHQLPQIFETINQ